MPADLFPGHEVGTVAGFSGMGGAIGGMVANLGTGYIVSRFSYAPIFLIAGLMHPMSHVDYLSDAAGFAVPLSPGSDRLNLLRQAQ